MLGIGQNALFVVVFRLFIYFCPPCIRLFTTVIFMAGIENFILIVDITKRALYMLEELVKLYKLTVNDHRKL